MGRLTGFFVKAVAAMRHAGRLPFLPARLARTRFDYAAEVGTGIDSSVVTAPVQWIQRAFPEARLRVMADRGTERVQLDDHEMVALVAAPNPFYGDGHLWAATLFSWCTAGNAHWVKVRNGAGRVAELWYVPHWTMAPKWPEDGSAFIGHYEYRPGGGVPPMRLEVDDVVHFRHGIDPRNPRLGLSPMHGAIREIFMDLEASNFVASLLRNMGVPGVVISPEGAVAAPDDTEAVKTWFREAFGGDRRGDPLVMGAPTKVQQYGFTPQQMDLSFVRNVAEERVCASLGIPAAVVGFGAGLEQTKVGATMAELRKLAWTNGILPILRALADELQRSLAPDFRRGGRAANETVEFDTAGVTALEEDQGQRAERWGKMVTAGYARVDEAREAMGLEVDDADRIYLRPFSAVEVPAGAPAPDRGAAALDLSGLLAKNRARPTPGQRAYVETLDRLEARMAEVLAPRLADLFGRMGTAAAVAFADIPAAETGFAAAGGDAKAEPGDAILVERILEGLDPAGRQQAFRRLVEAHYLEVAQEVAKAGELVGLATDLPDPVARAVIQAGGRRAGLIDLTDQSRRALFDALEEGRAAGEGAQQLAQRIRERVAAGPWATVESRSRTIARTETKYAQNVSTMARARAAGVERFIVFDGRLGPGRSVPSHIARDGTIVDAPTADRMAAEEHPNGTLSFAPYFEPAAGPAEES